MGIDASIISGLKFPHIQQTDPLEQYSKSLALKNMMQQGDLHGVQLQAAQQGLADETATRTAYQQAGGDSAQLRALLQGGGQYKQIQALDKLELENLAKRSEIGKNDAAAAENRHKVHIAQLEHGAALLAGAKDQPTYENALRVGALTGTFTPEFIKQVPREYSPDTVAMLQNAGITHAKQLEDKRKQAELAQTVVRDTATNARGIESNLTTRRGQNMADARARDTLEQGKTQVVTDAEGNINVVNKGTAVARPATNAAGVPLKGNQKPLTEAQGKAAGMAHRATTANDILNSLEDSGEMNRGIIKQGVEQLPMIGGAAAMGVNMLPGALGGPSPAQQRVEQARRDFVNAALRVESGAAISQSEFQNAERQYFPQPGDDKTTIAQKRKNRETELEALRLQSGPTKIAQSIRPVAAESPTKAPAKSGIKFLGFEGEGQP